MLSRVADSLYWMSRYLERAVHTARLIDVDFQLRLDQSRNPALSAGCTCSTRCRVPVPAGARIDSSSLAYTLTLDRSNPSSIVSCISSARENMRQVREQCSSEMWEQLNRLYLQVLGTPKGEAWLLHSQLFFRSVQDGAHLFQGVTNSTMSHGEGWHYIYLGRYVERTHASGGLDRKPFSKVFPQLARDRRGQRRISGVGWLAEKLRRLRSLLQEIYCRDCAPCASLSSCCSALTSRIPCVFRWSDIHSALQAVGELTDRKASAPMRLAGRLRASLSFTQIEEIMAEGLDSYLANIRTLCAQAHTAIHQIYFDYPVESAMVS